MPRFGVPMLFACVGVSALSARAAASSVMLASGVTSKDELCMTASKGVAGLEGCSSAIRAGDGRELWEFQSGGQLVHSATKECLGSQENGAVSEVLPVPCGSAGVWETTANGQLKSNGLCLSQSGIGGGVVDLASKAAVVASSTFDPVAHGAWAAVDGNSASYWASKVDEKSAVSFVVDLGGKQAVSSLKIFWEFPAKVFAVELSSDGSQWEEVIATTTNVVKTTEVSLTGKFASKVKIVMKEAGPQQILGGEHRLYGIKSLRVVGPSLRPILEDCAVAGKSTDARDKYFMVSVSGYDPAGLQAWKLQQPLLEAAAASLSSTVSELQDVVPKLDMCKKSSVSLVDVTKVAAKLHRETASRMAGGFDVKELLAIARESVLAVRSKLV